MTNWLEDVPMHILASAMVFAMLNAHAVNALALEDHDRWQQFMELVDSIADAVDTIQVPAGLRQRIASPMNDPNLEDDTMELDSTLCTDEAESVPPLGTPSQGPHPVQGNLQLTSMFVPQYDDEDESDADTPLVLPREAHMFVAVASPSNWQILNAAPAVPERDIPKDLSEASHSRSNNEGDGDEGDLGGDSCEKCRQSRKPPDMTEAVPDPYDKAG
jgi:hypothetical protein